MQIYEWIFTLYWQRQYIADLCVMSIWGTIYNQCCLWMWSPLWHCEFYNLSLSPDIILDIRIRKFIRTEARKFGHGITAQGNLGASANLGVWRKFGRRIKDRKFGRKKEIKKEIVKKGKKKMLIRSVQIRSKLKHLIIKW